MIQHLFSSLNVKQSFWTLSGATTPVQSEPGSDCIEGILHISQSSSITGASSSECLMSYQRHSFGRGVSCPLCRDAFLAQVAVHHTKQSILLISHLITEMYILTQLCHEQDMTKSIFRWSTAGLNSVFSPLNWLGKKSWVLCLSQGH